MTRSGIRKRRNVFLCVTLFAIWLLLFAKYPNMLATNELDILLTGMKRNGINQKFRIFWYNPTSHFTSTYKEAMDCGFEKCKYSNCEMTLDKTDANVSHAVIFDGRFMPKNVGFTRPNGQIWIFEAHESPISYVDTGTWWYRNKNYSFNWTMTYDKDNSDIYLPYGEIVKHKTAVERDFKAISQQKNKTMLIIVSHCNVRSKRQEYVNKLKEYIDVDVLGACGKKWKCGTHYNHDEYCFNILNKTYKFYLAFENAFCHQYITEKFYENFNYDIIMLVRGGSPGETKRIFPNGTYISTDDFKSVQELANFIKHINVDTYADYLKRKSQFYSIGYLYVYQRALCNLCERMNFQRKYAKTIKDIKDWAFASKPCIEPKDVSDIR